MKKKSGVPTILAQASQKEYTAQEAIQKYFLYQYIRSREGYYPDTYNYHYRQVVRVFSVPSVYRNFFNEAYSPNGPIAIYGKLKKIFIVIKSVQYLASDLIQVRFVKQLIAKGNVIQKESNKIALVKFRFVDMEMSFGERVINPLGFQVTSYKVDNDDLQ